MWLYKQLKYGVVRLSSGRCLLAGCLRIVQGTVDAMKLDNLDLLVEAIGRLKNVVV